MEYNGFSSQQFETCSSHHRLIGWIVTWYSDHPGYHLTRGSLNPSGPTLSDVTSSEHAPYAVHVTFATCGHTRYYQRNYLALPPSRNNVTVTLHGAGILNLGTRLQCSIANVCGPLSSLCHICQTHVAPTTCALLVSKTCASTPSVLFTRHLISFIFLLSNSCVGPTHEQQHFTPQRRRQL